jgi:hypothetical protein
MTATPNHALQRTAACVTAPASAAAFPPTTQVPRSTLISDALPFGRLWYDEPNAISNAIGYRTFLQPLTSRCGSDLR